jgi:branched-chain amino acid transport system ATP-binding protein
MMVEQNALAALELSDRAYVMEQGRVTRAGTGKELLSDPEVKKAYLGG